MRTGLVRHSRTGGDVRCSCDELLKGKRITEPATSERKEHKVDKQVKALINRTLSGFKTMIFIGLTVACVGSVCMFEISYGLYRPMIGFAVMMLFEVCDFALTALAVSKARDVEVVINKKSKA